MSLTFVALLAARYCSSLSITRWSSCSTHSMPRFECRGSGGKASTVVNRAGSTSAHSDARKFDLTVPRRRDDLKVPARIGLGIECGGTIVSAKRRDWCDSRQGRLCCAYRLDEVRAVRVQQPNQRPVDRRLERQFLDAANTVYLNQSLSRYRAIHANRAHWCCQSARWRKRRGDKQV